jgi:hypothetical protein
MQFYRVYLQRPGGEREGNFHHGTMAEAHKEAKAFQKEDWRHVYVDLIDVPTDKQGVLNLLQRSYVEPFPALRTWELTTRGGLIDVAAEEA